jgi:hypothetical protein
VVDKDTRLDRLLTWFKNNRVFSVLMLLGVAIVGASQLISSISRLVDAGEHLLSKPPSAAHSDDSADRGVAPGQAMPEQPSHAVPPIAVEVLRFGAAGTGPSYLDEPWWISISPQGELVIGESVDRGRIQRFDLDGRFLAQWFATDVNAGSAAISGIAIDAQAGETLYVGQLRDAYRYDLKTGKNLGELDRYEFSLQGLDALASDPRGGAVALWVPYRTQSRDLVRFDAGAKTARLIKHDVLKDHAKAGGGSDEIAVDGTGNIFILVPAEEILLKYAPDGEYVDRMGESGNGPGQWRFPDHVAVDGQGRIAVSGFNVIHVLSSNGHYLGKFNSNCPKIVRSLAFDIKGFLYILCNDTVIKYQLKIPQAN